jgi:hypothetical protein
MDNSLNVCLTIMQHGDLSPYNFILFDPVSSKCKNNWNKKVTHFLYVLQTNPKSIMFICKNICLIYIYIIIFIIFNFFLKSLLFDKHNQKNKIKLNYTLGRPLFLYILKSPWD